MDLYKKQFVHPGWISRRGLLRGITVFSLALFSTGVFYCGLKNVEGVKEKIDGAMTILGPALPFLICEFCLFVYWLCYWKITFLSALSFLMFLVFFAVIALSLRFVVRLKPAGRARLPVIFFLLLVVLVPISGVPVFSSKTGVRRPFGGHGAFHKKCNLDHH